MSEKPPIGETEPVTLPTYAIVEAEIRDATCEKAPVPGLSPHREFRQGVFQDSPRTQPHELAPSNARWGPSQVPFAFSLLILRFCCRPHAGDTTTRRHAMVRRDDLSSSAVLRLTCRHHSRLQRR